MAILPIAVTVLVSFLINAAAATDHLKIQRVAFSLTQLIGRGAAPARVISLRYSKK